MKSCIRIQHYFAYLLVVFPYLLSLSTKNRTYTKPGWLDNTKNSVCVHRFRFDARFFVLDWDDAFIEFVKNLKQPMLLIYDGHGSHLTYNYVKHVMNNCQILICVLINSSHAHPTNGCWSFVNNEIVQCDVLKTLYRENRLQISYKAKFPFLLKKLFDKMNAIKIIIGFRENGLYALNRNTMQHHITATDNESLTASFAYKSSTTDEVSALYQIHL